MPLLPNTYSSPLSRGHSTSRYLFILGLAIAIDALLCTGCGAARANAVARPAAAGARAVTAEAAPAAEAAPGALENGYIDVNTDKSLNTSSYVRAWTGELLQTASRFRRHLYQLDGYVMAERIDYEDRLRVGTSQLRQRASERERHQAVFEVSLPLEHLPALLDWLRMQSIIVEQYVVSQRDGALAQPTAVAVSERAQVSIRERLAVLEDKLVQASDADRASLEAERAALLETLAREQTITRVPDIRLATLTVHFEADQPQVRFAAARLVPSVRASTFVTDLLNQDSGRELRLGAAIGFGPPVSGRGGLIPSPIIELAGYPATAEHAASMLVTAGGSVYARSFGDGERVLLNPFVGIRAGYAYIDRHAFAIAGELGIELFKFGGVAWSASARPHGLIGKRTDLGLEAGTSLSIAF